jgi:hypothetical protein
MRQVPVKQGRLRIPCTFISSLLLAQVSWAQVSLGLSSSGVQSGVMPLSIVLNSAAGSEPASLQWSLAYPTSSVTQVVITAGPRATAVAKAVTCKAASGSQTCLLEGLNTSKILNGVVATATLQLSTSTTGTPSGIQFTKALGASQAGKVVPITTSSVIQIVPIIRSLLCSPALITVPASASCTVTISAPAPTSGAVVSLGTAATGVTFSSPASVTLASGTTSATYAVSTTAATTTGKVTATASLNGSSASSSFSVQPMPPIRVNCGGPQYKDGLGHLWSADYGYSSGSAAASTTAAIAGTTEQGLYQMSRSQSGTLQYQFSMPNGTHTVNLRFAETKVTATGQRVFNIVLNGKTVRSNLDIFSSAGGANKALVLPYLVSVTNGQVLIQLVGVVGSPSINAIDIIP